jgi:hypothetical protein
MPLPTLALPKLYADVMARFATDAAAEDPPGTAPSQAFGWREPAKRSGSMRVVWVPGDDSTGEIGEMGPARNPGRNPRSLGTLAELFTVYLEAVDLTAPENELAQYKVARHLFDAWFRALYLAAHGTVALRSVAWVTDKTLRRYGATIRVVGTIESVVADAPLETAPVDVHAEIEVNELDVSEDLVAPEPEEEEEP